MDLLVELLKMWNDPTQNMSVENAMTPSQLLSTHCRRSKKPKSARTGRTGSVKKPKSRRRPQART